MRVSGSSEDPLVSKQVKLNCTALLATISNAPFLSEK